jgi:hypothetical protein
VRPPPAILMPVFGNIGEQRKMAERPHDIQRLLNAQSVQLVIKPGLDDGQFATIRLATQSHRELSNVLDAIEYRLAVGRMDDIAQQTSERLNFLPEAGIFFI